MILGVNADAIPVIAKTKNGSITRPQQKNPYIYLAYLKLQSSNNFEIKELLYVKLKVCQIF